MWGLLTIRDSEKYDIGGYDIGGCGIWGYRVIVIR